MGSFFGKDEALAPMLKKFIEMALQTEMDAHLDEKRQRPKINNGKRSNYS